MKRHTTYKNAPNLIKQPLQSVTKTGKPIFVYIRRSTTNKQELSIQRQEDNARETIEQAWFNPDEVEYYIESMTAYNGVKVKNWVVKRRRIEFTRMLHDIDSSPLPVTLLTYEDSRLSRNDPDTNEILARLFWEYEPEKKNLEKIIFNGGEVWTDKSNKWDVKQRLLDRYKESLKISERSSKATLRELRKWRYILSTPVGIDRLKSGESFLVLNEDMPYVKKAWEMRADGVDKKTIVKFLSKQSIKIGDTFEQYFQTLIYTWNWIDPESGELIPQFFEWWKGNWPISMDLFNRVQKTLIKNTGRKAVSKWWEKQGNHLFENLLKWEDDELWVKKFTVDFKTKPNGKVYLSFKSNANWWFNKTEIKIIKVIFDFFERELDKLIIKFYKDIAINRDLKIEELWKEKLFQIESLSGKLNSDSIIKDIGEFLSKNEPEVRREIIEWLWKFTIWLNWINEQNKILSQENQNQLDTYWKINKLLWFVMTEDEKKKFGDDMTELWTIFFIYQRSVFLEYIIESPDLLFDSIKKEAFLEEYESYKEDRVLFEELMPRLFYRVMREKSFMIFSEMVRSKWKVEDISNIQHDREIEKERLKKRKDEKETENKDRRLKLIDLLSRWAITDEDFLLAKEQMVRDMENLEASITWLSESTDIEDFLHRLPEILSKIFELSSKTLSEADSRGVKDDFFKLIELTIFELSISTKKELQVKLFEGLEDVLKLKNNVWLANSQRIRTFIENFDRVKEKYGSTF